ncbi:serine protease [Kordiimonas sp. SCSIO 12610]|uniref:S1 family peptidase n=1 Tax=Kordiimonas sp. SCSIO 12610 TaxID=2829597 RepID=UPI00210E1231|nr:serine protease [Kordiimonas sp. SCSIO 12610]UTW55459.1 trypsin-like peptidase domain-containing protein [Kordiimonas sp. SCSIO 12610]
MRRFIEFFTYAAIIIIVIVRYAGEEDNRSPRRAAPPKVPAQTLPDNQKLPINNGGDVLVNLDTKLSNSVGTAFAVDAKGTYVTARHVVDGCTRIYIAHQSGRFSAVQKVTIDQRRDFAVLKSNRVKARSVYLASIAPDRGDDGYMMGYPQGNPADVRATVIGRNNMRSSGRYNTREPVIAWVERERLPFFNGALGGISGGPVFDGNGIVVGTVVAGAPRRGRVYTTHPRVFLNDDLGSEIHFREGLETWRTINAANYADIGKELRGAKTITQVYCQVTKS